MMRYLFVALASVAVLASSPAAAEEVIGLVGSTRIVTFDSASPGTITSNRTITGLASGVTLTGIDLRPADNQLYSVSTTGTVYRLTLSGGNYTATSLGPITNVTGGALVTPEGSSFGLDFNPTVDRLRMVSDTNQNLRINQTTTPPGVTVDTTITIGAGSTNIDLIGSAYTNNFAGATTTTLFGIDAFSDSLVSAISANAGTYSSVGLLGILLGSTDALGFDISGTTGAGFFSVGNNFYGVNLATGSSTLIGALGTQGITGITIAAVPETGTWAMMLIGFGAIGVAVRRRRRELAIA